MELKSLITDLISHLQLDLESCEVVEADDAIKVNLVLSANDSGVLIGYHGETIEALQTLVALMANHGSDTYRPVEVDVNGYRQKRADALTELAQKAADSALQSGREIILPPLSPRERRLIHVFLEPREDVTTYSEGEGASRRLVVRPTVTV